MKPQKFLISLSKLVCLFLLLVFCICWQDDNKIIWNADRKLTWDDFIGTPDKSSPMQALTAYRIEYSASGTTKLVTVVVTAFFKKTDSWLKAGCAKPSLLRHEQIHFDLAELFARKLRQQLSYCTNLTPENVMDNVKRMCDSSLAVISKTQEQYDKETNHSIIDTAQARWEKMVPEQIKELDAYKSTDVKIPLK